MRKFKTAIFSPFQESFISYKSKWVCPKGFVYCLNGVVKGLKLSFVNSSIAPFQHSCVQKPLTDSD